MPYLPPFDSVRRSLEISTNKGELRVSVSYDGFIAVLKRFLSVIRVDEAWYAAVYPDVQLGIESGAVVSARQHFIDDGYFEGRLPEPPPVDETWYMREYPDVADSVKAGRVRSAAEHFVNDGYKEGRRPHA